MLLTCAPIPELPSNISTAPQPLISPSNLVAFQLSPHFGFLRLKMNNLIAVDVAYAEAYRKFWPGDVKILAINFLCLEFLCMLLINL